MRTYGGVFLLFSLFIGLNGAEEGPGERIRSLIFADMANAAPEPNHWPDLSLEALRKREASDRITLPNSTASNAGS